MEGIVQQLVRPAIERSVYLSGPLMSSKESAAERRADLLSLIEDQVTNGVYKTQTREEQVNDPITGKEKTVIKVELMPDGHGGYARQEKSPLAELGIKTYSFNINGLLYDKDVEDQIKAQQKLAMDIQTAIAKSKQAEQQALTAAKEGEANAAKAKWEQEVIKATEVTKAEQEKEVAALKLQTADLEKKSQILLGEGEASRAKSMMDATGYLPEKLAAWKAVALVAAESAGKQRQTPDVVMGSGGSTVQLTDLMQAQLAKQMGVHP
jgi:hypothetical protein